MNAATGPIGDTGPTGDTGPAVSLQGIQTQLIGAPAGSVDDGDNVLFDTVVNDQSPNISYNAGTGEFTISTAGNYKVSWWVATNGAGAATLVTFGIVLDAAPPVLGMSPLVTGQVVGNALLTVAATPGVLSLVNETGDVVFFADTPVQADIVIEEVL